jgi:hypothetical protein
MEKHLKWVKNAAKPTLNKQKTKTGVIVFFGTKNENSRFFSKWHKKWDLQNVANRRWMEEFRHLLF